MDDLIDFDDSLWPEPTTIDDASLASSISEEPFNAASFELLKEAAAFVAIAISLRLPSPSGGVQRNHAIILGHMARMLRLMRVTLILTGQHQIGDQLMALFRQFMDSASTVLYILELGPDSSRFDAYVNDSLIAENEFLKVIDKEVAKRGGLTLPIEDRIRRSIETSFRTADVRPSELPARDRRAWPSAEQRIAILGPAAYVAYRMGSNALHGGWSDIEKNYLIRDETGLFRADADADTPRPQAFLAMSKLSTLTIDRYVSLFLPLAWTLFEARIADFSSRVDILDAAHEKWLNR